VWSAAGAGDVDAADVGAADASVVPTGALAAATPVGAAFDEGSAPDAGARCRVAHATIKTERRTRVIVFIIAYIPHWRYQLPRHDSANAAKPALVTCGRDRRGANRHYSGCSARSGWRGPSVAVLLQPQRSRRRPV
jgi:hypothetical protein